MPAIDFQDQMPVFAGVCGICMWVGGEKSLGPHCTCAIALVLRAGKVRQGLCTMNERQGRAGRMGTGG